MRGGCEFPIEHEGPCSQTVAKRRATRLSVDQVRAVDQFAELLFVMFPHAMGVAVVGSSLTRDDWRDVDIRIIAENNMVRTLRGILDLDDLHMLLSQWGQRVTGLPIDCQLQERSDHEREAYTEDGAPRFHWRGHGRIGDNARRLRDAASELFPDDDPESEVAAIEPTSEAPTLAELAPATQAELAEVLAELDVLRRSIAFSDRKAGEEREKLAAADTFTIRWGSVRYAYPANDIARIHVRRMYRSERRVQMIISGGQRRDADRTRATDRAAHFLLVAQGGAVRASKASPSDDGQVTP